jgi:hypothetical protein
LSLNIVNKQIRNLKLGMMKQSEKKQLDERGYRTFVGTALWTVFRCWKVDQWAYNLKNEKDETFWSQVKEGKPFKYEDEEVVIKATKGKDGFNVMLRANVLFADGERKVKESKPKVEKKPTQKAETVQEENHVPEKSVTVGEAPARKGKQPVPYTEAQLADIRLHEEGKDSFFWNVVSRKRASEGKIPANMLASIKKEQFVKKTKKSKALESDF